MTCSILSGGSAKPSELIRKFDGERASALGGLTGTTRAPVD